MTVKQRQCLLYYLGYYVGNIDGVWGQLSKISVTAFQKDFGLVASGKCDAETEKAMKHAVTYGMPKTEVKKTTWDDIKYFSKKEFACKCGKCGGYPADIDMGMVKIADTIRERIGKPIGVNSGLRCREHNSNVGGAANSQHLYGTAADLGKPSGVTPGKMAAIAQEIMGETGGIGIYSWGIHIDTRKAMARWNG